MRIAAGISAVIAAMVLFAGCGGGDDPDTSAGTVAQESQKPLHKLSITLDGYAGPENVGILMAGWKGYFDEAGLEVSTYSPTEPRRPVRYTVDESVDVAISREPEVVLAQSKGSPIVAIGSLIAEPTAAMIWLGKSEVDSIAELKGKTIGTAGLPVQEKLLESILAEEGLSLADVTLKNTRYNLVPALADGRVDAIFGGSWNLEGEQLKSLGMDPVVTRVEDLGIPPYDEYAVIVRRDRLAKDPQLFRSFMAAVNRGTATAIEDPDLAFEVINENVVTDFRVSPKAREAQVDATLPLLSESGEMDPDQASGLIDWMKGQGMIERKPPVSSVITNEYLTSGP
jgi:putative hydroxymethylpyrimidine transport system substrate-binding protein